MFQIKDLARPVRRGPAALQPGAPARTPRRARIIRIGRRRQRIDPPARPAGARPFAPMRHQEDDRNAALLRDQLQPARDGEVGVLHLGDDAGRRARARRLVDRPERVHPLARRDRQTAPGPPGEDLRARRQKPAMLKRALMPAHPQHDAATRRQRRRQAGQRGRVAMARLDQLMQPPYAEIKGKFSARRSVSGRRFERP